MISSYLLVIDILIVALIVTIVSIIFFEAPVWFIIFPLIPIGIVFIIWLIRKIDDFRDD